MLTLFYSKNLQNSHTFSNINESSKQRIYNTLMEFETQFWQYYDYMAEPVSLKKDDLLIEQGHVPDYLHYLTDGGYAKRFILQDGKEQSLGIFEPFEFACPLYNFTTQKPSMYGIKMITDATVFRISYKNYMFLKALSPDIDKLEAMIANCSINNHYRFSK